MPSLQNLIKAKLEGLNTVRRHASWVKEHHGVGILKQVSEIYRLQRNGLPPTDYYKYALFDPKRFPDFEAKLTYRGYKQRDEFRHFSDPKIWSIAYHKHILYRLLETFGLPVPEIIALYSPRYDGFERHRSLTQKDELGRFLLETDRFPLFGKPSNASHGYGALAIYGRSDDDRMILHDATCPVDEVVDMIHVFAMATGTYMLCEKLAPVAGLQKMSGDALPSIRFIVLMNDSVPMILKVTMLSPRTKNYISNAQGMRTGNISCDIDIETGVIIQAMDRPGPDVHWVETHPDSGERIKGHQMEHWDDLKAMVLQAAQAMSPFKMQHWDVSICDRGPVVLEMNFIGDIEPMQIFGPTGVCNDTYMAFANRERVW